MDKRVVVTGLGAVTPLGNDVDTMWNNMVAGKLGIGPITLFDPTDFAVKIAAEVKDFEPHLALDGGMDGLDIFRRILAGAPSLLAPGGMLCVELFEENVHVAADLVRAEPGWSTVEVREDLTHRPRVLVAVREA